MKLKAFQSIVYLQIRRRWLSVRVLTWSGGDFRWEGASEVFITVDAKGREKLIEAEAARMTPGLPGRFFTAFAHPRVLIDSFPDTLSLIDFSIRQTGYKRRSKSLIFLVHVRDEWEGGLADIELRTLREMCGWCGAREFIITDQPAELTPPQVLEIARGKNG